MKKKLLASVLTLVLAVGALTGCGQAETASADSGVRKLKIGIGSASPGASFINDAGELDGYDVELWKLIDESLPQYEIEFVQLEGTAMFASLDSKKVDLVNANFRRSDAREAKYIHTYRSYFYTPYVLVNLEENGHFDSIEDYIGKTIATGDGSLMADIIEQYIQENNADINVVYAKDLVGELAAGRADGVAFPRTSVQRWRETYPDLNFYVGANFLNGSDKCMADANAYWYFRKEDEQLRNDISEALYAIRQKGTLLELSQKWFNQDFVSDIDVAAEEQLIEDYGITNAAK